MSDNNKQENLAFVLPSGLSERVKDLQEEMDTKSAGEVLVKAISLLEVSLGRKLEIKGDNDEKWEIDEFEKYKKKINIKN